jgi:hypothetical protein
LCRPIRAAADTFGEPQIIDKDHEPQVEWYLPDEVPGDF